MSAHGIERLVYMANQIARHLVLERDPVSAVADHIIAFWTPAMRDQLIKHGATGLDLIAAKALEQAHRHDVNLISLARKDQFLERCHEC